MPGAAPIPVLLASTLCAKREVGKNAARGTFILATDPSLALQHEIIAGLIAQQPSALEELFDRLSGKATGLARRILNDDRLSEDVVQESFLAVWRRADRLESLRGRLDGYVLTVVHHKAIDAARVRQRRDARDLPIDPEANRPGVEDTFEEVSRSLDRTAIQEGLMGLPDAQRQVIEMAFFGGLTHTEISTELGIPAGTVKSRLRLGLVKLRGDLRTTVQA